MTFDAQNVNHGGDVEIIRRYRCAVCGHTEETSESVWNGDYMQNCSVPPSTSGCWMKVVGSWVCPKHKVDFRILVDDVEMVFRYVGNDREFELPRLVPADGKPA